MVVSAKTGGEGRRLDWQVVMEECRQLAARGGNQIKEASLRAESRSGKTPRQWDLDEEQTRETEDGRRGDGTDEMGLMTRSTAYRSRVSESCPVPAAQCSKDGW